MFYCGIIAFLGDYVGTELSVLLAQDFCFYAPDYLCLRHRILLYLMDGYLFYFDFIEQ